MKDIELDIDSHDIDFQLAVSTRWRVQVVHFQYIDLTGILPLRIIKYSCHPVTSISWVDPCRVVLQIESRIDVLNSNSLDNMIRWAIFVNNLNFFKKKYKRRSTHSETLIESWVFGCRMREKEQILEKCSCWYLRKKGKILRVKK